MVITRQARFVSRGRFAHGRFSVPAQAVEQLELRAPSNPAEVLALFPCGADDVDETVASAATALPGWQRLGVAARADMLARFEAALRPRLPELAFWMQRELGRPAWECERELGGLVPRLHDTLATAREELVERRTHATVRVRRRALGVVAVLGPVMFPLATSHAHLMAALVAGNTVVWKPSPLAAASAQLYVEAVAAAGLPRGVFNLMQGGAGAGERLLLDARVDGAVFIGSQEHARAVRRLTADRLELKTLLHVGAKNPAVVLADADVATTVSELVQGAFATAGQRPNAIGRVLVEAAILEPFLEHLAAATRALVVECGGKRAAAGPMFSRARAEAFAAHLAAAEADGARAVLPVELTPGSCVVRPSIHVVEDARRAAAYRERELFGPNLLVEPVADLGEALLRLRGRGGLYAALFSHAAASWHAFTEGVESGALLWNHSPMSLSARVPFAGRESASRGPQALLALTREAAACDAATAPALPFAVVAEPAAPVAAPPRLAPVRVARAVSGQARR